MPGSVRLRGASCPIFAYSVLRSSVSDETFVSATRLRLAPATVALHLVNWVGWTLNCSANSASVLSPLTASQGHLGLEGRRRVIPSCSLHRLAPLVRHQSVVLVKPGYHLAYCRISGASSLIILPFLLPRQDNLTPFLEQPCASLHPVFRSPSAWLLVSVRTLLPRVSGSRSFGRQ